MENSEWNNLLYSSKLQIARKRKYLNHIILTFTFLLQDFKEILI